MFFLTGRIQSLHLIDVVGTRSPIRIYYVADLEEFQLKIIHESEKKTLSIPR